MPPPPSQCEMCAAGLGIFKRRVIRLFPVQLPKHSERHDHEIRLLQQQKYITSPIRAFAFIHFVPLFRLKSAARHALVWVEK